MSAEMALEALSALLTDLRGKEHISKADADLAFRLFSIAEEMLTLAQEKDLECQDRFRTP